MTAGTSYRNFMNFFTNWIVLLLLAVVVSVLDYVGNEFALIARSEKS